MSVSKGAIIMTISILASRFLSLFFIFPFSNIVGPNGLAIYSIAYTPFVIFLDLTTLGIPQALTKLTSKYINNNKNVYKLFIISIITIMSFSLISIIIINLFAHMYLKIILPNQDIYDEEIAIRILSSSLLFTPLVFLFRSFMQGHKIMHISAISQVLEQVIRVSLILISCYLVIRYNKNYRLAVYSALIANTISAFISFSFLYFNYKRMNINKDYKFDKDILKELIINAIPYLIFGISINSYGFIDSLFYTKGLYEFGIENPKYYFGVYSFEINKLIMIPVSLSVGYAISILPNLTTRKKDTIANCLYIIFLIICPIMIFTFVKGDLVYSLFFKNEIGYQMLKVYSIMILLLSFNQITSSIMQGINKGKSLIIAIILGTIIKFILTYPFILRYGIYGNLVASVISLITIISLNIYNLKNEIDRSYLPKIMISFISGIIAIITLKYKFNDIYLDLTVSALMYFIIYILGIVIFNLIVKLRTKNTIYHKIG